MRVGISAITGQLLVGWPHCVQSLDLVMTTHVGEGLVMLAEFGNEALEAQDRNATPARFVRMFVGIVKAITAWEPGFRVARLRVARAGPDGLFAIEMPGRFYPKGHLDDYSVWEDQTYTFQTVTGA